VSAATNSFSTPVFVVAGSIARYRPEEGLVGQSEAFTVCTLDSLATTSARYSKATFTLLRGATPREPVNGLFSFVPCRPWVGDDSRFERPAVRLPGIVNPLSRQSPSGTKTLWSRAQVAAAWHAVIAQLTAADLELGAHLAEPSRCP
jgi:hypothetical protein